MISKVLRSIKLSFLYGEELEVLLKQIKYKKEQEQFELKKDNLNLCLRHQQEENRSHYSEDNCDHCKVLKKLTLDTIKDI